MYDSCGHTYHAGCMLYADPGPLQVAPQCHKCVRSPLNHGGSVGSALHQRGQSTVTNSKFRFTNTVHTLQALVAYVEQSDESTTQPIVVSELLLCMNIHIIYII